MRTLILSLSPHIQRWTVGLVDAGSTLSDDEGESINVCVSITQDAPGGRECPIEVTLSYAPSGDKPGECVNILLRFPPQIFYV